MQQCTQQYLVTGMSCAACSAHVEKAVAALPGIKSVSVSLLTNSMAVEAEPQTTPDQIIGAVKAAGYGASLRGAPGAAAAGAASAVPAGDPLADTETPALRRRLIASLCFLLPLMALTMGHMVGIPTPGFLAGEQNAANFALAQLLLTLPVLLINQKFFVNGARGLWQRAPGMDALVALGAGAAVVYGVFAMAQINYGLSYGDMARVHTYLHDLYFESAAMILTLITVGKMLEARSKGRTTSALRGLMDLAPKTANVLRGGQELTIPIAELVQGDVFVVRPGESIPADGVVEEGESAVNEAALTGESLPADKAAGDTVSAATLNQSGFLRCRATRVGQDTTLSQIIQMVQDAAAGKAPLAKIADKVSGVFVPVVISIALLTAFGWLAAGQTASFALARGISVLVISCPCALGLATPVAIMVGSGMGAKNGILFKTAASLEAAGRVRTVVLDKTGTVTAGRPQVTDIVCADGVSEAELLALAAALEAKSEHPLARAVLEYAAGQGIAPEGARQFEALPGHGLRGLVEGRAAVGGNAAFAGEAAPLGTLQAKGDALAAEGKTPLYFAAAAGTAETAPAGQTAGHAPLRPLGLIAVADVVKPTSAEAIRQLQGMGVRVVMLTGDNRRTAEAIGRQVGVDEVVAGVLPAGKEAEVRRLSADGGVAMVGDGINDAPALTSAAVGIAIGAGADVAIDAADLVLMKSDLLDVPAAIRLSRAVVTNIHENLFWAFLYNSLGIPLAMGLFARWGLVLNPMFGAAAMSLSSFCVVTNALRLNLFDLYSTRRDHKRRAADTNKKKGETTMTKTLKIEGMMCAHCSGRVEKALNGLEGVTATVNLEAGTACVTCPDGFDTADLKKAVEDAGYTVTAVE